MPDRHEGESAHYRCLDTIDIEDIPAADTGQRRYPPDLEAALSYAKHGLAVFPCRGKVPAISGKEGGKGCKDATTDALKVHRMWRYKPGSNIGIATGGPSGFWVLDVDGAEGEKSLADLEAKYGKLPETVVSVTGTGGRHFLFRYNGEPIKNRAKDIADGLDTRATGGYIVAPPSRHPDTGKLYQWADGLFPDPAAIAEAPAWLVDLASGNNRRQRERQSDQRTIGGGSAPSGRLGGAWSAKALEDECRDVSQATAGGRNDRLNRAAYSLGQLVGGEELERGAVERALFAAAVTCGYVADKGENQTLATIKSGLDSGEKKPRRRPPPELKAFNGGKVSGAVSARPDGGKSNASVPPFRMDSPDDVLRAFNEKYAVVNESGKVVIYRPTRDEQLKRNTIERILFEDFRRMYMNQRIQAGVSKKGNPIYRDVGTLWLEHEERRQHLGGVVMDPTNKAPADCWNLWKGFSVEAKRGDWSLMRGHIRDVICGGDETAFAYVMGWLARMVQFPDQPGEVAVVLQGKKGTGKGTLGNWLIRLLGQHGVHVTHAKHLVGAFNAHLRDAVFVFADEAFFAGDKQHEGVLKALVTEPFITIEAKYQNAVTIANMTHILMASNSDWVVPVSSDERRYCVLEVSDSRIGDRAYFTKLNAQMENGGLAAMLHDLSNLDISSFNVRDVPQTEALADQKKHSLDSLHRWWLTVLQRGFVYRSRHGATIFTEWSDFVSTELLYRSYLQWCDETRERWRLSRVELGKMLKGIHKAHRPRSGPHPVYEIDVLDPDEKKAAHFQDRPPGYLVGRLEQAQAAFARKTGIPFDWEDDADFIP